MHPDLSRNTFHWASALPESQVDSTLFSCSSYTCKQTTPHQVLQAPAFAMVLHPQLAPLDLGSHWSCNLNSSRRRAEDTTLIRVSASVSLILLAPYLSSTSNGLWALTTSMRRLKRLWSRESNPQMYQVGKQKSQLSHFPSLRRTSLWSKLLWCTF